MAQRRHNFISGAAVLALAVAVTKVLGALYKIPLGNLLDKEGMAHFYAAYNIYNLLLVLSTAGLPLALSRLVSRAAAQGRRNAQRRIFRTALALLAVIGAVCSAVMCLFPQVLSGLLHDSLAAPAIRGPRPGGAVRLPDLRHPGVYAGLGRHDAHRRQPDDGVRRPSWSSASPCAWCCCTGGRTRPCAPPAPSRRHRRVPAVSDGADRVPAAPP